MYEVLKILFLLKLCGAVDETDFTFDKNALAEFIHRFMGKSNTNTTNTETDDSSYFSENYYHPGDITKLIEMKKRRDKSLKRAVKVREVRNIEPKVWDHWSRWSGCTVTCGVGKMTRWRHCVSGGCSSGEKEAQIKTCYNSAC